MRTVQITPPPLSPQSMADLLCTIIILCTGKRASGKVFWAYLCIKPSMAKAFKEARDRGSIELEEFGTVVEQGEGDIVPPETRLRMERDYGVNHNFEADLLKIIDELKHRNEP